MLLAMAGAMSTAELGLSLAEMIRRDKVHAISCTGANLEEDVFNLVAHDHYKRIPNWRNLTAADEKALERAGLNRVTDTCIPEDKAFRAIEKHVLDLWVRADQQKKRYFPHEIMYQLLLEGRVRDSYQIDPAGSWLLAAAEKNLPIFVPGWEDSTLGNIFVSHVISGQLSNFQIVKSGLETMEALARWYVQTTMGKTLEELPAVEASEDHDSVHLRAIPEVEGARDGRLLPDRRRHRGRLPDLRRADDPPGSAPAVPVLGLLLPDQRLDHELRLVQRRVPDREDHLGQARREHAHVPDRVRRHDRRAADVRVAARLVVRAGARHAPWHFLNFFPDPHGQGSLRPTLGDSRT